ncbi:MAG: CDF family Co(II)/Ni(II) efflux transporter DmeF [Spirochaetales bacterium]|jgi:cation diffusion facilitator family transporter|nr:CDF family Co(II)/Ni(II) efflux transporter DmeF [Spirochaetales bacterium]
MHRLSRQDLTHTHRFDPCTKANERKTMAVIILTFITMGVEITTGILTGSMALLADGWHMGTHAFALGITWFAYIMARRYTRTDVFSFGTGKFGILAGYTSALFLGITAIYMIVESIRRFLNPVSIGFNEAIIVAIIGLVVNIISVWVLQGDNHHHDHDHHHDHNLKAAHLHVLADALTSILAISALLAGKYLGLSFLDPVMGIVGGLLIGKWAWGLLKSSGFILLDGNHDPQIQKAINAAIEIDQDAKIIDLHVWKLSSNSLGAIITLVAKAPDSAAAYHQRLQHIHHLDHVTIEIHRCADDDCTCRQ